MSLTDETGAGGTMAGAGGELDQVAAGLRKVKWWVVGLGMYWKAVPVAHESTTERVYLAAGRAG